MAYVSYLSLLFLILPNLVVSCFYEDVRGTWNFHVGPGGHDNSIICPLTFTVEKKVKVTLNYPDVAKDDQGNTGFWTMVYSSGFEVVINDYKYFAFQSRLTCDSTMTGWSHHINSSDWACYYGTKESSHMNVSKKYSPDSVVEDLDRLYVKNMDFINKINNHSKLWKAVHYPEFNGMTLRDRLNRAGGMGQEKLNFPRTAPVKHETQLFTADLPASMDWRNLKGENFVTPVRNQGHCGSCYAFGSLAMLESRLKVLTNNSIEKIFSPQDVISCSRYTYGCNGGLAYLTAGKYAEDYGVVEETCFPYYGTSSACSSEPSSCTRYHSTKYKYVGGYYGACNEQEILMDLVQNGPVSVAFYVTQDFQHYKSGIYQATGLTDKINPWKPTNHAVLIVGYGEENGVKFWIVKNSWGMNWGENGYFRIVRGSDELNIESMALSALPVMPKVVQE